ncbi:MAG: DNA repair protein RecN [Leptospirales bacterium]
MILHLKVSDLATFKEISLDLKNGLTCLTGETGSGKSLFVDAISFVTGRKPRILSVSPGAQEGIVEAVFTPVEPIPLFLSNSIKPGDDWILRRVLLSNGRTRQTINGANITQSQLSDLGEMLLDLVGQGEGARLQNPRIHSEYLDAFGGSLDEAHSFEESRTFLNDALSRLEYLKRSTFEREQGQERIRAIIEDQKMLQPLAGEWEKLQSRLTLYLHLQDLLQAIGSVYEGLYAEEGSVLSRLKRMTQDIGRLESLDARLTEISAPLLESSAILKEVSDGCRHYLDSLDFDPESFRAIGGRVEEYQRLSRKYAVDPGDLFDFFDQKSQGLSDSPIDDIILLEQEVSRIKELLIRKRTLLSEKRKDAASRLGREVTSRLSRLKLEKASFYVDLQSRDAHEFFPGGGESVRFFFTANIGVPPKPLDQVASGGELSRILLVLKWLLSEQDRVETLVFDEVDSGIGGEVGETVGDILSDISRTRQVITITHLHQVARKAMSHLVVQKQQVEPFAVSTMGEIGGEDRVREIARMLGGSDLAPSTLILARELLLNPSD